MNKKVVTYQNGGKENPLDAELRGSYNKVLPYSNNRTVKDVTIAAAKKVNIDPALLLSSAWQEGFNQVVASPDKVSDAYLNAQEGFLEFSDKKSGVSRPRTSQKKLDTAQYPVDAFFGFGVDQLEANYSRLKKYLPAGFESRFQAYDAYNDATIKDPKTGKSIPNPQKVRTAAFKTIEDALIAKGAFLNLEKENVLGLAKKRGVTLDPEALDYFTLASYNQGFGGIQDLFGQYASAPDRSAFLKNKLANPKSNVAPRINRLPEVRQSLGMAYGGKMPKKPKLQNGDEIDPLTGQPKLDPTKLKKEGVDVFGNALTAEVPINPNADPNEQIFRVQEQQGSEDQAKADIIPLSQFFDITTDKYGNKNMVGTGKYVTDEGRSTTQAEQQSIADQISQDNLMNANKLQAEKENAERIAATGITAINSFFNKKNTAQTERTNRRKAIMDQAEAQTLNPYLEGTGSQAIYAKGGKMASGGGLSRSDDYGSKKKPYPSVSKGDFAGGHRSYPIPTRADAVDALRLAGLHGRSDVKAKVYAKYPDLKKEFGGEIDPRDAMIKAAIGNNYDKEFVKRMFD